MKKEGVPNEAITAIRDSVDLNLYFFENKVEIWQMYAFVGVSALLALLAYVVLNLTKKKKQNKTT